MQVSTKRRESNVHGSLLEQERKKWELTRVFGEDKINKKPPNNKH